MSEAQPQGNAPALQSLPHAERAALIAWLTECGGPALYVKNYAESLGDEAAHFFTDGGDASGHSWVCILHLKRNIKESDTELTLFAGDVAAGGRALAAMAATLEAGVPRGFMFSALPVTLRVGALGPFLQDLPSLGGIRWTNLCHTYVLPMASAGALAERCAELERNLPDGTQVISLTGEHAQIVNDHWTYRGPHSMAMIQSIFARGAEMPERAARGVMVDGELVAWCIVYKSGSVGMLYTKEAFRGRGLGRVVAASISSRLASASLQPYCHIVHDNDASMRLFAGLGFERCQEGDCEWVGCGPLDEAADAA